MRQARDRQRESLALSDSNPDKSVANIFRHRSSSKRGHELPPLLNDNKVFLIDDTDKAELFSAFFAKHLATESDPVPFVRSLSDRTLSTIDVSSDLIKKNISVFGRQVGNLVLRDRLTAEAAWTLQTALMGGKPTKIIPGIYIGANENAKNEEELIANCISHILSVQSSAAESIKSQNHVCHHVCVRGSDEQSLLRVVPDTNDFIHSARVESGNVLVHSESGMSANIAVVAAYLMSLYELDSRTAVSVLQGLVHAAQPVHHLQDQLDRFGAGPSDGGAVQSPPSSQVTAASEHARLLEKYGPWPGMEADRRYIEAALSSHDDLKASGVFLGDVDETAAADLQEIPTAAISPTVLSPTHSSAPRVCPKLRPKTMDRPPRMNPKKGALIGATSEERADDDFFLEEDLDEPRNGVDGAHAGQEDPAEEEEEEEEEDELSPVTFPDEEGADKEEGSDGGDDEEADEVVGSIPVPRGLMEAGDGGHLRFFAASYRPPASTKMTASGNIDLGLDIASLLPNSDDRPAGRQTSHFATTAPTHGFYGWPM
ncbi:Dual specificity protein phosphatase 22 [Sparganum proliferum]